MPGARAPVGLCGRARRGATDRLTAPRRSIAPPGAWPRTGRAAQHGGRVLRERPPCPKHTVDGAGEAGRRTESTSRSRSGSKTPGATRPAPAAASPVNGTPWYGRWTAIEPSARDRA
ncbi:hypothetical protein [Streptomyces sp. I6]|uniref:hypothetical protein n=1 Tax=Streptomyces sp. I6 TaxID=2483113 RepID=UPI0016179D84|nr:hypothetical protein [Streptomyces sp. I6]